MIRKLFITPFQKFINTGSLAGILLLSTTILALIWANSPFAHVYENLLRHEIGVSFQNFEIKESLLFWINDGLMAIFFFLIGLELKRELLIGELNTVKKAAFPFIAALGGVLAPVAIYMFLNHSPETEPGWGIVMATDIAFALAVLSALGKRAPLSLKIFLTAFAIIDDIAAVLVIALFYSTNIEWSYILYGLLLIGFLGLLYHKRKYTFTIGIILAIIIWFLFLGSGIHPTIAGVLLAFTIPIKRRIDLNSFSNNLTTISDNISKAPNEPEKKLLTKDEMSYVNKLIHLTFEVRSPLQQLEHALHNLIAYFILPVFAFANAGVTIGGGSHLDYELVAHIAVSLFVGKMLGVSLFSYISVKLKLTELPSGVKMRHVIGISAIAGVGFTMSIFIANLAFLDNPVLINSSKVGIVIGSVISGIVGYTLLRLMDIIKQRKKTAL
ncbi:Na+/H+ antiporter NhaA [Mariniflexile ostreae]|uniref:Na(+)/H(+) antiporter NhaA n=1 Tax=Mariniflexile ostreae TaxID=1520892 RepID=A0ABV5F926_9FLAO